MHLHCMLSAPSSQLCVTQSELQKLWISHDEAGFWARTRSLLFFGSLKTKRPERNASSSPRWKLMMSLSLSLRMKNQFISVHFDFQLETRVRTGGILSRSEGGCLAWLDILGKVTTPQRFHFCCGCVCLSVLCCPNELGQRLRERGFRSRNLWPR